MIGQGESGYNPIRVYRAKLAAAPHPKARSMKMSRPITWSRLKVLSWALLLVLFALGGLLVYASTLGDRQSGQGRWDLRPWEPS